MTSFAHHIEFSFHILALLLGFNIVAFLTLAVFKYKNIYLKYLWLSYFSTTLMLIFYTLQFFIDIYTSYNFSFINWASAICMSMILFSVFFGVAKLLYTHAPRWCYLIIYILTFIPILYIPSLFLLEKELLDLLFKIITLEFYFALGLSCFLFGLRFKYLDDFYGEISKPIWIILSFFVVIFISECIFDLNFNPLPFFYGLWSIAFIYYFWKNIFTISINQFSSSQLANQFHITEREKEIIDLIILGKSNKAIGEVLFISEKTVKNHVYNIYKKLGINSRFELMVLFNKV